MTAFGNEALGDGQADAGRSAADDGNPARKIGHVIFLEGERWLGRVRRALGKRLAFMSRWWPFSRHLRRRYVEIHFI